MFVKQIPVEIAIMDHNNCRKVSHLVVDSAAFLKNAPIFDIAEKVYTLRMVIDEIKDRATRERLQVLPDELMLREPSTENIRIVTEFSKKTGDYPQLSAVDLRVLALTYELHKEHLGVENLRSEPLSVIMTKSSTSKEITQMPGFYRPKGKKPANATESSDSDNPVDIIGESTDGKECENELSCPEDDGGSDYDNNDDDDEGWVDPDNLNEALKGMGMLKVEEEDQPVVVACITSDFAMQNTLIQLGLKVISIEGMLIRCAQTFIFRCYGCFKTTTKMTSKFCPHCGNKTLRRVAVTTNDDGSKVLHLNFRRPINPRGSRYPLPMPKGGKHTNNPILVSDQPVPQNRPSKMGILKTDALNEDYIAGLSPFAMNDVYSRAANLGIHGRRRTSRNQDLNIRRRK